MPTDASGRVDAVLDGTVSGSDGASEDIGVGEGGTFGRRKHGAAEESLPCRALRPIVELLHDDRGSHAVQNIFHMA